jgi:hypothetical protein
MSRQRFIAEGGIVLIASLTTCAVPLRLRIQSYRAVESGRLILYSSRNAIAGSIASP